MPVLFPIQLPEVDGWYVNRDGSLSNDHLVDTFTPETVDLADLITRACARCGLLAAKIDVTDLVGTTVIGFVIAREANIDTIISTLGGTYLFDAVEFDGKVHFVKRGNPTVANITEDDLVERDRGAVSETRDQEVERPRKIILSYFDPDTSYTPNTQPAQRLVTDLSAVGERTVQVPVVMDADSAIQLADQLLNIAWTDLLGGKEFILPDKFSYLVPTDCINLTYRGRTERLRLTKVDNENGKLLISARQDRVSSYQSTRTGTAPDPSPGVGALAGPTLVEFVDVRPLRDADDRIGFYVAPGALLGGWTGCQVQASWDGGLTYAPVADVQVGASLGYLTAALAYHPASTIDNFHTLTVHLFRDSLASVTFEQLINEANGALVGDEVIQFQTATLIAPRTYQLTGLARGRLGTDAVAHVANERFVLLAGCVFVESDRTRVGKTLTLRGVSYGTAEDAATAADYTFACNAQLEFAPNYFADTRDGSNNVTVTWSGAGRLGANTSAEHGQYFTHYAIAFTFGGTTVTKTSTSESYAYDAATQTTDFGSPPASLAVSITQVNSITGAGPALTGTV